MFKNKILMITGGTGSFGNAVLKKFLHEDVKEIRIFSRDEKKQDDMRIKFNNSKIKFYLGDVRDSSSIHKAMKDVDYVFSAAALKQVPSCEFYPLEAIKTNVIGSEHVMSVAIEQKVKRVVMLSTDKAVYPINAMGMSKAMMEKVMVANSRMASKDETTLCATRYGNVMASRGSVIPLFVNQIKQNIPITITDPNMTRFLMSLDDSVDLVLHAFMHAEPGDIFVQKAPASTVHDLALALLDIFNKKNHKIITIGTRHGEKLYETLVSREEISKAEDMGNYYRIPADNRDLNYAQFFSEGQEKVSHLEDYTSHNTDRLSIVEIQSLLLKLDYIKDELNA
jgi:UDP-N-acetylglucosamine 4,6-dehydratase